MMEDKNYIANFLYDHGPEPIVFNIDKLTRYNTNFRTTFWTGDNFQLTLMSIPVGGDIGLEIHYDVDQFLRIESGVGMVRMGEKRDHLNIKQRVNSNYAIIIPQGTWHNLINIGNTPLKVYSIYAPPQHPFGTVHRTKADENH